MPPKEPTRNQFSRGLGYQAKTPAFLQQLQQRIAGGGDTQAGGRIGDGSDGRPPIPTRPEGESSGDEEDDDERPQVVVVKEGRHLSAHDAENEKRKAKGLPPLPDKAKIDESTPNDQQPTNSAKKQDPKSVGPSVASSGVGKGKATIGGGGSLGKRKVAAVGGSAGDEPTTGEKKKKKKKAAKGPLSFGDGLDE